METRPPAFESLESRTLFAATWLYGVDSGDSDSSSNLFRVDAQTGDVEQLGETGFKLKDIAFTPDGQLWGVTNGQLISIDPQSGFSFIRGRIALPEGGNDDTPIALNALTSDTIGRLWAATNDGTLLSIEFDPFFGNLQVTERGEYGRGWESAGDLSFTANGFLYATGSRAGGPSFLLRVNPITGRAFGSAQPLGGVVGEGLATGPKDELMAVVRGNTATPGLLLVNRNTGAGVEVGQLSGTEGVTGLAAAPQGSPVLAYLMEQAQQASEQTFAQLYNAGTKYAAYFSTTLANGQGADIFIDLADYYSSVFNRAVSTEGQSDWITVWVNRHEPNRGGDMPFTLGAVPLAFARGVEDPTGAFQYGRVMRDYPWRRDPLVVVDSVNLRPDDIGGGIGMDGNTRALYGARTVRGADPRFADARVEIKREALDSIFRSALEDMFISPTFEMDPELIAEALADELLVLTGPTPRFDYAAFTDTQLRAFTTSDNGIKPGPGRGNAPHIGTFPTGAAAQRFAAGWVGRGAQSNYFRFTLTTPSSVNITLPRLEGAANLYLENGAGTVLAQSTEPGFRTEEITQTLTAGTYFVRVQSASAGSAGYSVKVHSTPTVAANWWYAARPASGFTFSSGDDAADDELDLLGGEALADL